jgi:hypothetical protein
MTLTTDQLKGIADDLEALGDELGSRNWTPDATGSVMTAAAGSLVSIAAMRSPVPQQAYCPPPPYPYGPEDFSQNQDSVPLQVLVTGSTRQELEDRAYQAGRQVFGDDASLAVTLTGTIARAEVSRDGVTQYQCSASVRQEDSPAKSAHYSPRHPAREDEAS